MARARQALHGNQDRSTARRLFAARGRRLVKEAPRQVRRDGRVHLNLGLNVRHADQELRGTLMLPHGTGKEVRVAVFAEGEKAKEAQDAGADVVGAADLAKQIEAASTTSTSRSRRRT